MLVLKAATITSLVLATALAIPAHAQEAKQCSIDEGKPSEVGRAYLAVSQVAGAQNANPDAQKATLAGAVRLLTQGGATTENPVGHAYELGKLLVLWSMQPGVGLTAQRGTLGYATDPSGTISIPAAVDSAFDVVEKAMPECASETIKWRSQKGWITLVNQSIQELNSGSLDSASVHATESLLFNDKSPYGYMVLGQVAQRRNQPDSAIALFQKTIQATGTDTLYNDVRQQIELNLGNVAASAASGTEDAAKKANYEHIAKTTFEALAADSAASASYRESAKSGLVKVNIALGDTASARAAYQAQLSDPSKFTFTQVLQAGVSAAQTGDDAAALTLFHAAYEANPYHRDAISNLIIYELKAQHYDTALVLVNRLNSVDPNGNNGRLAVLTYAGIARKYQDLNKDIVARYQKAKAAKLKATLTDSAALTTDSNRVYTEKAVEANAASDSMAVVVAFTEFSNTNDKATLAGTIANNTQADKTYTMKVDFLDKTGAVVASQTESVGPVGAGQKGRFSVSASAPGITAFKYAPLDH